MTSKRRLAGDLLQSRLPQVFCPGEPWLRPVYKRSVLHSSKQSSTHQDRYKMRIARLAIGLALIGLSCAYPQYAQPALEADSTGIVGEVVGPVDIIESVVVPHEVTDTGCPAYTHDCVPHHLCQDNGEINTSGAFLIDVRFGPKKCTNPDYPEVPGICCRIPGATPPPVLDSCPLGQVCLGQGQCGNAAITDITGITDPNSNLACYVQGTQEIGTCCAPPVQVIDTCPGDSVCLPEILCQGEILDNNNKYVPFGNGGIWSQCSLSGDIQSSGVCCRNPVETTDIVGVVGTADVIESVVVPHEVTDTGCPDYTHDCVPHYLCLDNGEINTSGAFLIDARIKPKECKSPEGPGICCRIPGATPPPPPPVLDNCPSGLVCLGQGQCGNAGSVDTTGVTDPNNNLACYIPGTQEVGTCCGPPVQIIDTCPGDSVCLPEILCQGEILDDTNNYIPFGSGGAWSQCFLSGDTQTPGVCCRNLVVTEAPYKAADQCGVRNYGLDARSSVKLNKNEAIFGEFPWQAIVFFSNYTFKCGASLVGDRWLVTGAHCVAGYQYNDFRVRLGEWQVDTYNEPLPYVDVEIAAITVHPNFNPANLRNDVAVIELTAPVKPEYHINTVCLPALGQQLQPGTRCYASGWGKDAFEGAFQAILKKVDVPFVEHKYCQDLLRQTRLGKYFQLDKSFMCAGGEENQDACTGDGGGPLVCEDPNTGSYFLHGITAWGINCGQKDVPGVYADVQFFANWINDIIHSTPVAGVNQPNTSYGRK